MEKISVAEARRSEAIGRRLSDVFEAPFVDALHADRRENPDGSTLFRVPLVGRNETAVRLLVNATAVFWPRRAI